MTQIIGGWDLTEKWQLTNPELEGPDTSILHPTNKYHLDYLGLIETKYTHKHQGQHLTSFIQKEAIAEDFFELCGHLFNDRKRTREKVWKAISRKKLSKRFIDQHYAKLDFPTICQSHWNDKDYLEKYLWMLDIRDSDIYKIITLYQLEQEQVLLFTPYIIKFLQVTEESLSIHEQYKGYVFAIYLFSKQQYSLVFLDQLVNDHGWQYVVEKFINSYEKYVDGGDLGSYIWASGMEREQVCLLKARYKV